ncbi:hypothetical protein R3P38DRAFT_3232937 [Favolaschia claudopus]|uniref:Uncharacterized protein n=1 Tax=Favolaschia claudopus TaxID=2862362 RepID=A0AAV9ZHG7_9AGAR
MEGHKKIVQMTVGGMTQYLTAEQGMPKDIEEYFDKRIKNFIWAGKRVAPINHDILFLPIEEGGRDLLSIKDRNNAIEIKNLKDFLTRDESDRAKWCSLAEERLRKQTPKAPVVYPKKLPRALKKMVTMAMKFNLKLDALALAKDVKEEVPMFFHVGGKKELTKHNNPKRACCLRDKYGTISVGDMVKIIERNYNRHGRRKKCVCKADRLIGCKEPYKCQEEAIKFLSCIHDKWNPQVQLKHTIPQLTPEEKEQNIENLSDGEPVVFDTGIELTLCFARFRGWLRHLNPFHSRELDNNKAFEMQSSPLRAEVLQYVLQLNK